MPFTGKILCVWRKCVLKVKFINLYVVSTRKAEGCKMLPYHKGTAGTQAAQKVCPKTGPSMAAFWHVRPASRFWQPLIMR